VDFSARIFFEFLKKIEYFRTAGMVFSRQVGFFVFWLWRFSAGLCSDGRNRRALVPKIF